MSSLEDAKNNFDKRLREISPGQPESWYKSQLESQPFVKNPEKFGFKTKSMSSLEQEAKKYKSAEEFVDSVKTTKLSESVKKQISNEISKTTGINDYSNLSVVEKGKLFKSYLEEIWKKASNKK